MSLMAELHRTRARERADRIDSLSREIAALAAREYCVAHNEGTWGGAEAIRKCGTADPYFANRHVYESVGGATRATGPDEEHMPGYLRRCVSCQLADDRAMLAGLRDQRDQLLREARRDAN